MVRKALSIVFALAAMVLLTGRATAQDKLPERAWGDNSKVGALAVTDSTVVHPGETFRLAVDVEIEAGWHIYGNPTGPGTGKATELSVVAPKGIRFSPVLYSKPFKYEQLDLGPDEWVWAYEEHARLFLKGQVAADVAPGDHEVKLTLDVLACTDSCVPDFVEFKAIIRVAAAGSAKQPAFARLFEKFDQARTADGKAASELKSGNAAPEPAPAAAPSPITPSPITPSPITPSPITPSHSPAAHGGDQDEVLSETKQQLISSYSVSADTAGDEYSLIVVLLLGFLAGMILNVMPCVLPVISIKILSLVQQANEDRRRVFIHGVVFSAGIMVVFLVLAGLAAFGGQNWGSHFQSVEFQVAMIVLIFLFALGLFDVYSIEVPGFVSRQGSQVREGYAGSFSKGMLATLLATPCSGPLLGAVLTWALTKSAVVVFVVFVSIGLGMAIPYIILTANPAFLRFVPRPGPWMARFKELMGFFLLATVIYLLGIVSSELRIWVLVMCLSLALGAWVFGKVTGPERSAGHRLFWRTAGLLLAVGLSYWSYGLLAAPSGHGSHAETFSLARLEQLGREGRTVMVDWTAAWCPNCKLVEKVVLQSDEVQAAMKKKGVIFLVADITSDRPVTEALMNRLGSVSIPFLAVFAGDNAKRPMVLRDMYSRADVLSILDRCPDPADSGAAAASSARGP